MFFFYQLDIKTKIFNFTHKTNQAVYMEKQSTLKQYVLPFIRVNTFMTGSWIILVTLFRMSEMEIPSSLSKQYGTLILFGISALISFLWIYRPHFKELKRMTISDYLLAHQEWHSACLCLQKHNILMQPQPILHQQLYLSSFCTGTYTK